MLHETPGTHQASDDPVGDDLARRVVHTVNQLHTARFRRASNGGKREWVAARPDVSVTHSVTRRRETLAVARVAVMCARARLPREDACAVLHNDWLRRNHRYATTLQRRAYVLLTEQEKVRYSDVYEAAVACYHEGATVSYIA